MKLALFGMLALCLYHSAFGQTTICGVTDPKFQFKAISWNEATKEAKLSLKYSGQYIGKLTRAEKHDFGKLKYNLYFKADAKYFADEIEIIVFPDTATKYVAVGANYRIFDGVRFLHSTITEFNVGCNTH